MARTLPLRIVHATGNKAAALRKANRAIPFFVVDGIEGQVEWIVVQHLFELCGRDFVGTEVFLILVIPIKFDSAGH